MNAITESLLSIAVVAALLLAPGCFLLRSIGFSKVTSFLLAPVASMSLYLLEAIALSFSGIRCNGLLLAAPSFLVSFAVFAATAFRSHRVCREGHIDERFPFAVLGYVAFMAVVYVYVYYSKIPGPDFAIQGYDSVFHYNLARAFLESGNYSPLSCSTYPASSISPFAVSDAGFYPAAWHILVAMCVDLSGVKLSIAAGAVSAFGIIFILSSGMFWLLNTIFPNYGVAKIGFVAAPAFSVFPWSMLVRGEQYPQLLAFCFVPLAVAQLINTTSIFVQKNASLKTAFNNVLMSLACLFVLALTQPNSVFTTGVFVLCYWVGSILWHGGGSGSAFSKYGWKRVLQALGVLISASVVWYLINRASFMRDVVEFSGWQPFATPVEALAGLLRLDLLISTEPQIAVAVFSLIGLVAAAFMREYRWLILLVLATSAIYLIDVSFAGPVQHLFAGFWYSDPDRVASMLSMSLMPSVALGLYSSVKIVRRCSKVVFDHSSASSKVNATITSALVVVIMFACMTYFPNYNNGSEYVNTAFGNLRSRIADISDESFPGILDKSEREFVSRVEAVLPEGSLIVNVPDDGSSMLYGLDGMNVLYKRNYFQDQTREESNESDSSWIIRTRLKDLSHNKSVQNAVKNLGATYVLLLDNDAQSGEGGVFHTYDPVDWDGIAKIDDQTPGFEIVLSDGDMRLYRIAAPDGSSS